MFPFTAWDSFSSCSVGVLNVSASQTSTSGRFLSVPEPGLSSDVFRHHASAWWTEFPQAYEGSEAAHRLAEKHTADL